MDWLTTVGVGAAASSGAGKTTLATSAVDALRASRLEGLLSRMSYALGAVANLIALCNLAAKAAQITGLHCHYSPTIAP
jgi:molybdopterin-guanine dinucleotide biosynthesis protein